jgi:hypothetical protein
MQQTDCNIFSSCHVSLPIPGCDRLSPYPYHDQFALFPCHTLVTAWFSVRPSGGAPEAGLFAMDPISFASHEEPPWRCEVSRRRRLYPVVVVKGRRSSAAEAKGARYQDRQSRVEAEARARESLGLDIFLGSRSTPDQPLRPTVHMAGRQLPPAGEPEGLVSQCDAQP